MGRLGLTVCRLWHGVLGGSWALARDCAWAPALGSGRRWLPSAGGRASVLGTVPGVGWGLWPTVCVQHSDSECCPAEDHALQTSVLRCASGRRFCIVLLGILNVWGCRVASSWSGPWGLRAGCHSGSDGARLEGGPGRQTVEHSAAWWGALGGESSRPRCLGTDPGAPWVLGEEGTDVPGRLPSCSVFTLTGSRRLQRDLGDTIPSSLGSCGAAWRAVTLLWGVFPLQPNRGLSSAA